MKSQASDRFHPDLWGWDPCFFLAFHMIPCLPKGENAFSVPHPRCSWKACFLGLDSNCLFIKPQNLHSSVLMSVLSPSSGSHTKMTDTHCGPTGSSPTELSNTALFQGQRMGLPTSGATTNQAAAVSAPLAQSVLSISMVIAEDLSVY